jgi:FixJ family two-component response regulator
VERRVSSADPSGNPAPLRIGVVDDDPAFRRALERLLRGAGYEVETFASAEDYLATGSASRHGCLVLDVYLGGMSGLDLRNQLARSGRAVPVVFITAHQDLAAVTQQAAGAPCLRKPFDEELLFAAIARVTGESRPN